jgi:hypothetical protein
MGRRPPCCDKLYVKKGPWTAEEDEKILAYVASHGIGNWTLVPQKAGHFIFHNNTSTLTIVNHHIDLYSLHLYFYRS